MRKFKHYSKECHKKGGQHYHIRRNYGMAKFDNDWERERIAEKFKGLQEKEKKSYDETLKKHGEKNIFNVPYPMPGTQGWSLLQWTSDNATRAGYQQALDDLQLKEDLTKEIDKKKKSYGSLVEGRVQKGATLTFGTEPLGKCAMCGRNDAYRTHGVNVSDYGVRKHKILPMCESCIKAEEKGEL